MRRHGLIGPAAAAKILGMTPAQVRRSTLFTPIPGPHGSRLYRADDLRAYAAAHPPAPISLDKATYTVTEAAAILQLSEQRVRDLDRRLVPDRSTGRRIYAREILIREMQRRQHHQIP